MNYNKPDEKPYIVIIDDERDVVQNIKREFEKEHFHENFNLIEFTNSQNALNFFEEINNNNNENKFNKDIAFLLTDMIMPNKNGIEIIENFKKIFPNSKTSILTAYSDKESAIKAINLGVVCGYFEKPWNNKIIFPKIKKTLTSFISNNNYDISFVFTEINKNLNDFEEYFRARKNVWIEKGWNLDNKSFYDIDPYDSFSQIICGFEKRLMYTNFSAGMRIANSKFEFLDKKEYIEKIMKKNKVKLNLAKKHNVQIRGEKIESYNIEDILTSKGIDLLKIENISMEIFENIFPKPKYELDLKNLILNKYEIINKMIDSPLPAFNYHNENNELNNFMNYLNQIDSSKVLCEVGKLCILPKYRGKYYGNNIFQRLLEEMFANVIYNYKTNNNKYSKNKKDTDFKISDVIIRTEPRDYELIYKQLGFREIPNLEIKNPENENTPSMCYHLSVEELLNKKDAWFEKNPILKRVPAIIEKLNIKQKNNDSKLYLSCSCKNIDECINSGEYFKPINEEILEINCPIRIQNFLINYNYLTLPYIL
jgi:CheY-like chemotaxis protein